MFYSDFLRIIGENHLKASNSKIPVHQMTLSSHLKKLDKSVLWIHYKYSNIRKLNLYYSSNPDCYPIRHNAYSSW